MKTTVIKLSHIYKSFFLDDTKIDILKDLNERKNRSALAKKLVDGQGAERIVTWLEQKFL